MKKINEMSVKELREVAKELNIAGRRNFSVIIEDEETALALKDEGWNILLWMKGILIALTRSLKP